MVDGHEEIKIITFYYTVYEKFSIIIMYNGSICCLHKLRQCGERKGISSVV